MSTDASTTIVWPLRSNVIRRNKYHHTFGSGKGFEGRDSGRHWGWDFEAPVGTECYAVADGEIGNIYGNAHDTGNFGLVIPLKFEFEGRFLYAAYCHLSSAVVKPLDWVHAGQLIGYTGKSGNAHDLAKSEDHLHFELRTQEKTGLGGPPLKLSPLKIFKVCPLKQAIYQAPVGCTANTKTGFSI